MKLLLLLLASVLLVGAQQANSPQIQHQLSHTADDLLETSLTFQEPKEVISAVVLHKKGAEEKWSSLTPVFNKRSINAILPKGTQQYLFQVNLPQEQSIRYPEKGVLNVPSDLVQEKRIVSLSENGVDDKWVYKTINNQELFMDVFYPEGYKESTESFPTILIFHGGSWAVGETNWHYPDCKYWAKRGMVAVSVDYRLSKRDGVSPVPLECMKDAQAAVRYVRKHAEKLKIDPKKVVVGGGSAGGQLAASLGSIATPETTHSDDDLSFSAIPNAIVLYNPYFKCNYDPAQYVKKGLPPTISFLGDQDPAIPTESILAYHKSLKEHGNISEYYIGHGGKHGFCNGRNSKNPFFYWSVEKTDHFLIAQEIITGKPLIKAPVEVKVLTSPQDYTAHK